MANDCGESRVVYAGITTSFWWQDASHHSGGLWIKHPRTFELSVGGFCPEIRMKKRGRGQTGGGFERISTVEEADLQFYWPNKLT